MEDIDDLFVVDASVILASILLDEEFNKSANRILESYQLKKINLIAPNILTYEVLNGIRTAFIRKRITNALAEKLSTVYEKLDIKLFEPDKTHLLHISLSLNISIYDGTYVSLMLLKKHPLITADRKLLNILKKNNINNTVWIEDF